MPAPTETRPGRVFGALARWGEPDLDLPLALFRVALGVILLASYTQLLLDYDVYFGVFGMCPRADWASVRPEHSTSFYLAVTDRGGKVLAHLALVPMLAFTLGVYPRLAALLGWYALVSVHDRCPLILDGGDFVLRLMLFLFVFARSDRRLSPVAPVARSVPSDSFPIRLMQAQLCLVYLSTALAKLYGPKWQSGTALAYTLQLDSFSRADWRALAENPVFVNLATYGTLAFELSFAFLVWPRATRRLVLATGLALHLGIEALMYVPMFSWVMMSTYATFLEPHEAELVARGLTRPYAAWARRANLVAEVGPGWDVLLPRLDVLRAVTWRAAPTGPALRLDGREGATAWARLAWRVPSLLVWLPVLVLGGQGLARRAFERAGRP